MTLSVNYREAQIELKSTIQRLPNFPELHWLFSLIVDMKIINENSFKDKKKFDLLKKFCSSDSEDFVKWQRLLLKGHNVTKDIQILSKICSILISLLKPLPYYTHNDMIYIIKSFIPIFSTFFSLSDSPKKKVEGIPLDTITLELVFDTLLVSNYMLLRMGRIKRMVGNPHIDPKLKIIRNYFEGIVKTKIDSEEICLQAVMFFLRQGIYHKVIEILMGQYQNKENFEIAYQVLIVISSLTKVKKISNNTFTAYDDSGYQEIAYLLSSRLLKKVPDLFTQKSNAFDLVFETFNHAKKYEESKSMILHNGPLYLNNAEYIKQLIFMFIDSNNISMAYQIFMFNLQKLIYLDDDHLTNEFCKEYLSIFRHTIIEWAILSLDHQITLNDIMLKTSDIYFFEDPKSHEYKEKMSSIDMLRSFISFNTMYIRKIDFSKEMIDQIKYPFIMLAYQFRIIELHIKKSVHKKTVAPNVEDEMTFVQEFFGIFDNFEKALQLIEIFDVKTFLLELEFELFTPLIDFMRRNLALVDVNLENKKNILTSFEIKDDLENWEFYVKKYRIYNQICIQKILNNPQKVSRNQFFLIGFKNMLEIIQIKQKNPKFTPEKNNLTELILNDLTSLMIISLHQKIKLNKLAKKPINPIENQNKEPSKNTQVTTENSPRMKTNNDDLPFIKNSKELYKEYINKYQITYWYIIEYYLKNSSDAIQYSLNNTGRIFASKTMSLRYMYFLGKIGLIEDFVRCFEYKNKANELKFYDIAFDFSYLFLTTLINKRFNYYAIYLFCKVMMEDFYIPFQIDSRNSKPVALLEGNTDRIGRIISNEFELFNSVNYHIIRYFFVITNIFLPGTLDTEEINSNYKHLYKPSNYSFQIIKDHMNLRTKTIDQIKLEDLYYELNEKIEFFYDYKKYFESPFVINIEESDKEYKDLILDEKIFGLKSHIYLKLYNMCIIIFYYLSYIRMLLKTALDKKIMLDKKVRVARDKLREEMTYFKDMISNVYRKFSKLNIDINGWNSPEIDTSDPNYYYYITWKCIEFSFEITIRILECLIFHPLIICNNSTDYNTYGKYLWWANVKEGFYLLGI